MLITQVQSDLVVVFLYDRVLLDYERTGDSIGRHLARKLIITPPDWTPQRIH